MKSQILLSLCCLLLLVSAPTVSSGEEFLLYAPKPAAGDQIPASPDQGVLVRKVTVQRGDTLRKLSRKHIGVASWFPQVLLFNTIKNPDLIHPGERLLFPVRAGHAAATKEAAPSQKKAGKEKKKHALRRSSHRHKAAAGAKSSTRSQSMLDEQETYQRAKRAYLDGNCRKALDLFDGFLRRFPKSASAPDASLYRADCLLRLSGQ